MKKIISFLVINRIALFLLVFFLSGLKPFPSFLLAFGHRWDGNSYTFIATHGYATQGSERGFIVFPPLYPILIKIFSLTSVNPTLSGMIISNIFFVLGMLVLYKLIKTDWDERIARLTIILISIFPTTYFLSVAYPESLFIFLFAVSFLLAKRKSFLLSALVGGLAASTRPFGLIIFPSILIFAWKEKKLNLGNLFLSTFIFLAPIIPYLWINYSLFGSPFAFMRLLKLYWQKDFSFPWIGILNSWKRGIYTKELSSYKYFVGYSEAAASTIAWIAVVIGLKKWKTKLPYLIYLLLGTVLFTSTGFILSAPRYLLSIPPFFIALAEILSKNQSVKFVWVGVSIALLCWFAHDFSLGMWAF